MMTMIEKEIILNIEDLSKSYGPNKVLNNVSFKVFKGDILAIIGPSGSGKSTLLNVISKNTSCDDGQVTVAGQQVNSFSSNKEFAKKVGIIRQQFDLVRELEVIHNVLAGNLHKWSFWRSLKSLFSPSDVDQALYALSQVGIEDKAYQLTSQLSGGEQQRVAIARTIVQNPAILLADEPIASLDPKRAESILELLISIVNQEDQTLVASMHSVHYVKRYFNRVIALKNGEIVLDEQVADLDAEALNMIYELEEGHE